MGQHSKRRERRRKTGGRTHSAPHRHLFLVNLPDLLALPHPLPRGAQPAAGWGSSAGQQRGAAARGSKGTQGLQGATFRVGGMLWPLALPQPADTPQKDDPPPARLPGPVKLEGLHASSGAAGRPQEPGNSSERCMQCTTLRCNTQLYDTERYNTQRTAAAWCFAPAHPGHTAWLAGPG